MPDWQHIANVQSAARIEVGDTAIFVIPFNSDCFLKEKDLAQVGVSDGYGTLHWAPRKQLKSAMAEYDRDFSQPTS